MGFFPSPLMDPNRKDSDSSVLKFPQPFLNKGDSVPPDKNIQNEHFSKKEQNSQQEIHLNSWLSKGAWSVMEQGFFAFSNFLLVLLLARWLDPQDYGWFTVSYSIFLFLATIHTSLFTEPMLVFGDGRFYHQQSVYFKALLEDHGKFIFFSGVTLMIPGIFLKLRGDLGSMSLLLTACVATPFILTLWVLRRMCYLRSGPKVAAQAGLIYFVFIMGGALALQHFFLLTPSTAFGLLAASSLFSSCWIFLKLECFALFQNEHSILLEFRTAHWDYGRWALGTNVLTWFPSNIYFFVIPWWAGLEAGGALRASLNFLMPIMHVFTALSSALIPLFVRIRLNSNFTSIVLKITCLFCLASFSYWMVLFFYGTNLIDWIYAGKFSQYAETLRLIGSLPIFYSIHLVFSSALRAMEKPFYILQASLLSTLVTLSVGLWMAFKWKVIGAQLGWLVSYIVGTAFIISYFIAFRSSQDKIHA